MLANKLRVAFFLLGSAVLSSARAAAAVLSMPDNAQGGPGAVVEVPISLSPGDGLLGIDMTITYSTAALQAQEVTVSGIAAAQGFALVRNLSTAGEIIISEYAMQDPLVGTGEIARIRFLVTGAPGATSALTLTSASINENAIVAVIDNGLFTVTCAGVANGTACNDGNGCTANESCQAGTCSGGVAIQVPTEVGNVKFVADETITWNSASSAGPGTVHDVLRGFARQFPVGTGPGEICLAAGVAAATASDPATPPVMNFFWYLVRGRNTCGTGTYGFRQAGGTPGAERTSTACP